MEVTMSALERAYIELTRQEAVCRPRIDIQIPTRDQEKIYQWGTMEGGSMSGYFAIRMKSDVIYEQEYQGAITQEKYCVRPGRFCGLILLTSIENGEPLALINDGYLQHMRVGADSGIGAKYMAREDAEVVGMIGSGGMARSHVESFLLARKIKKIQVYSPTKTNRDAYAREISEKYGLDVKAVDNPRDVYKGADMVAGCTDSAVPIVIGKWLEEGTHVTCVGGKPDEDTMKRIDVSLRLGNAPAPWGLPEFGLADEYLTYAAKPKENAGFEMKRAGERGHGVNRRRSCRFFVGDPERKKTWPDLSKADHILRARQYSGRAVLCGGGKSLRAGEGKGARTGNSHRVALAGYTRLRKCVRGLARDRQARESRARF